MDRIELMIRSYQKKLTDNFYWSPNIPEKKLANVLNSYIVLDEDEQLICLYDSTVFGSIKKCLALSTKGIYWREFLKDSNYLSYRIIGKIKRKEKDLYISSAENYLLPTEDDEDDNYKLTFPDSQLAGKIRKLLTEVIEYTKDNNIRSNTLKKWIKKTLLNEKLTEEEKQEILEQYKEAWGMKSDKFESIVDKVASSIPFMRSARNVSFLNKLTGRQAYLDHQESKKIKSDSEAKYKEYSDKTVAKQQELNHSIEEYGRRKLETLKRTLGVFLSYLEKMEQRYKENYYELMDGCDFPKAYVAELGQLSMNNSELLKTAVTTGGFTYAAVAGVPAGVTAAVGALATASTGTAISGLSGAAATNATLAWLGGGSIAAGGTGIAGGTVVLGAITYSVTGIVAIAATGLIASNIMEKKLTQAQAYSSEVDIACEKMKTSWVAMGGIKQRVTELLDVTMNVYDKCIIQLAQLEPLVFHFDTHSKEHLLIFQKTVLLIKSMSELAKTPLFGDDMNLSGESEAIITKTRKVLNSTL